MPSSPKQAKLKDKPEITNRDIGASEIINIKRMFVSLINRPLPLAVYRVTYKFLINLLFSGI